MRKVILLTLFLSGVVVLNAKDWVKENVEFAKKQLTLQLDAMKGATLNPCTTTPDGSVKYIKPQDWRSGFFAGTLWYMYELTGDAKWSIEAEKQSRAIEEIKNYTSNHDVGFMIYCSFGNGLRLAPKSDHKDIIIQAAHSLCTRYKPGAGIIQSWNVRASHKKKGWVCPVIIDNMMNLELLFEASKLSGDDSFRKIALSHIEHTLQNHFRPDGSCYHVIDYDPNTGEVRHKHTHQGYANESAWSRGQAWAIYGFTMAYRYTQDRRYIEQAMRTFEFMRKHHNMEKDCVPYWDMDVPNIKAEPRDASSAAIIASGLYELAGYVSPKQGNEYRKYADKILKSLSSPAYRAKVGENNNFLLMHSVSSKPGNAEIDVPLNYADYYFLEALVRSKKR